MHIAIAFSKVNFATQEATIASVSSLLASMKVAAMISVVAVGTSILFMVIERILYKNMCKTPLSAFQLEMNKLFDNITSEKFLVELLRESKLQNSVLNQTFTTMPMHVPYLDNLIFSVNKLQDNIKKNNSGAKNILDNIFGTNNDDE